MSQKRISHYLEGKVDVLMRTVKEAIILHLDEIEENALCLVYAMILALLKKEPE